MRHSFISTHRSCFLALALAAVALTTLACGFEGGAFGSTPTPSANRVMVPAIGNAASSGTAPDLMQEPAEAILITSPQPGQGARGTLRVEGLSDPALAQQLNVVLLDAQGKKIGTAQATAQASATPSQRSAFSAEVTVPPDLPRQTGRVQVYNGAAHLASVEVDLNGDTQVTAAPIDPQTPEAIAIIFPSPKAEVKGVVKVAAATMLGPKIVIEVIDANNQTVGHMEQTVDLSGSAPAQIMAEVPITVTTAGPGRVLVYAVNARDGATEHLSSVEVNLLP
ncbi:MAG TPA: Gmad2 immunoglobulin-like domain-containing protein [Anaerolineae bacterium]|nr:Gmad2 immunoglobulin-like domain-containing protein [Anaerolineae bacterium]